MYLKNLFKRNKNLNTRSVVFYRHCYYYFYYLAKALRDRGWDAIVVNTEPVNGPNANYYHGEDLNLYHDDPRVYKANITKFFNEAKSRFKLMHFAGDGCLSFYPEYYNLDAPPDILEWKRRNNKIAYTVSGCNSGTSQTKVSEWSLAGNGLNVCNSCVWQERPDICSDQKNLQWGKKVQEYCDLIFAETLPALDYMKPGKNVIRGPISACLDPEVWSPDLVIPKEHVISRDNDEILVFHAVGNYDTRNTETRNIKGTPFILQAIERLQAEGHNVRLIFFKDKSNYELRYYQVQSDIIVDQLNSGRYGAIAREGMMLGKPVICYINTFEFEEKDKLAYLEECPLISATEKTVYEHLKSLVVDSELRRSIGIKNRAYALKWHSTAICAERYEQIYDQLFQ
jgi:glycosyltransferase involved in cell wall biosynthesis